MGWIADIFAVIFLITSTIVSAKRGIAKCLFGIVSTTISFMLAATCSLPLAIYITTLTEDSILKTIVEIAGYALIIILFILFKILIKKLEKRMSAATQKNKASNSKSRIMGGVFGFALAVLVIADVFLLLIYFVPEFNPDYEYIWDILRSSFLGNMFYNIAPWT